MVPMTHEVRIREILQQLRERAFMHGNGVYGDLDIALIEIDSILSATHISSRLLQIEFLIAPTANLQDLAIDCGWGDEFLKLAAELDGLI